MKQNSSESQYREFSIKEKAWIKKFEAIMKVAPKTLFLFVGEGVCVFAKNKDNQRYMTEFGSMDSQATCASISTPMEYDGGVI